MALYRNIKESNGDKLYNKIISQDPLDALREQEIYVSVPINESKVVKEILNAMDGNISILEAKTDKLKESLTTLKSKVTEYVDSKGKEKESRKNNSLLLSISFLSRTLVKNPKLDDKCLKEIKKINSQLKKEISEVYQKGTAPNETAKLKKALSNLDISDKYIDDKITIEYEKDKDLEKIEVEEVAMILNGLPYFTFQESYNKNNRSVDLKDIKYQDWFNEFQLLSNGVYSERYKEIYPKWIDTIQELYKDLDNNKDRILALGWNPELEFNIETRQLATKRFKSIVESRFNNILDISNIDYNDEYSINESEDLTDKTPVYIVITYTKSLFGKITQFATNARYTHAGFSLSNKLDKIYSYNMENSAKGFSIEELKIYNHDKGCVMALYCVFVDKVQLKAIKFYIDDQIANIKNSSYSFPNILGILLNKQVHIDNAMVCSQFVDSVFKKINIDITKKDSSLVTPQDFKNTKSKFLIKLYEGEISKYDYKKTDNKLAKLVLDKKINLNETYILEKELPVRFDDSGNLLISNMKKLDYNSEYYKSHRLLTAYEKTEELEGIKYELAKLWFMNCLLEEKIYDSKLSKKEKDEHYKSRAKILNDFAYYSKFVLEREKGFNFTKYYNSTPFSDILKVDKHTIKYTSQAVKNIAKAILI